MPQPVLATAGFIFIVLVVFIVVYFAVKAFSGGKKHKRPLPPPAPVDALSLLRARYEEIYKAVSVPNSASISRIVTNSYIPSGAACRHYCWVLDGILRMFPLWDSIAAAANAAPDAEITPREWKIPVSDIICFAVQQGLPSKFVVLQFKMDSEILTLSFGEEAARIFGAIIPQKNFSQLIEELYPRSSRNIYDIRENLQSLKELREEDLITEDEYAAKKKEMLILM